MAKKVLQADGRYCHTENCRVHDRTGQVEQQVSSANMYQSYLQNKKAATGVKHPAAYAAESSLKYAGTPPAWWKQYQEDAMNDKSLPVTPELLDVIDTPAGPVAVVWQDESHDSGDKGVTLGSGMNLAVCYFKSVDTGETLGYLKLCSVDKASTERSFGKDEFTPFRWASRFRGSSYPFNDGMESEAGVYGERNLTGDALIQKRREVWLAFSKDTKASVTDAEGNYVSYYNLGAEHVPDDKTVAKDMKVFYKNMSKTMKDRNAYYATPFVDFSRVEDPLKGKGFGAALYVYGARKLGQQGKVLRGSGLQSDEAQSLWGRFTKHFPHNVSSIKLASSGEPTIAPILDFRS